MTHLLEHLIQQHEDGFQGSLVVARVPQFAVCIIHTLQLSHLKRDSPDFWFKISCCPFFFTLSRFFTVLLCTILSLNLIILVIVIEFLRMSRF